MSSHPLSRLRQSGFGDRPVARWALPTILAAVPLCLACALLLDVPLARWAATAPLAVGRAAAVLSDFGLSGYMLVGSGLMTAACFWLARSGRLADQRRRLLLGLGERAAFVFSAVALSGLIVQVIKHVVGRARPSLMVHLGAFHFDYFSLKASLASFPSGHSTSIFALAAALSLLMPRSALVVFPFAVAVSGARVILDAHYASDVLAGAILGMMTTVILAAMFAERSIAFTRRRDTSWASGSPRLGLAAKPVRPRATL